MYPNIYNQTRGKRHEKNAEITKKKKKSKTLVRASRAETHILNISLPPHLAIVPDLSGHHPGLHRCVKTASSTFHFSATPSGSGGEVSPTSNLHKRVRLEPNESPTGCNPEIETTMSMDTDCATQKLKPASYAATLLQPLGGRDFNSEIMLGDFTLEEEDFVASKGTRGPSFLFSQKVEDKLNSEWNCQIL